MPAHATGQGHVLGTAWLPAWQGCLGAPWKGVQGGIWCFNRRVLTVPELWLSCRQSELIGCMSFGVKSLLSLDKVPLCPSAGCGAGAWLSGLSGPGGWMKTGFSHRGRRFLGSSLLPFPVWMASVRLVLGWLLEMGGEAVRGGILAQGMSPPSAGAQSGSD